MKPDLDEAAGRAEPQAPLWTLLVPLAALLVIGQGAVNQYMEAKAELRKSQAVAAYGVGTRR